MMNILKVLLHQNKKRKENYLCVEIAKLQTVALLGSGSFFGQTAFTAGGGIAMNNALGSGAIDDADGSKHFATFQSLLGLVFHLCLDNLIMQTALGILTQALFGRC
jgi:hypothetical protein